MNQVTKHKVDKYILSLLDYLDGQGIIYEDEDLVKEALKERGYSKLENIIVSGGGARKLKP